MYTINLNSISWFHLTKQVSASSVWYGNSTGPVKPWLCEQLNFCSVNLEDRSTLPRLCSHHSFLGHEEYTTNVFTRECFSERRKAYVFSFSPWTETNGRGKRELLCHLTSVCVCVCVLFKCISLFLLYECLAWMYICPPHKCLVSVEVRRGHQVP